jgi:hypothetical protein
LCLVPYRLKPGNKLVIGLDRSLYRRIVRRAEADRLQQFASDVLHTLGGVPVLGLGLFVCEIEDLGFPMTAETAAE